MRRIGSLLGVALSLALLAAQVPGFAQSVQSARIVAPSLPGQEPDTNRAGADFGSQRVAGAADCQQLCRNDGRCLAWTWVRPGVQTPANGPGMCWLKSGVPGPTPDACCISGVVARPSAAPPPPTQAAPAQPPGGTYGMHVFRQQWNPNQPDRQVLQPVSDSRSGLQDAANAAWAAWRAQACAGIVRVLSESHPAGTSFNQVSCAGGASGFVNGRDLGTDVGEIVYAIPGNRVGFTVVDPRFGQQRADLQFTLVYRAHVSVQGTPGQLKAAGATASIADVRAPGALGPLLNVALGFVGDRAKADASAVFASAFASLNAQLRAAGGPARIWVRTDKLHVAILPATSPVPAGQGTVAGSIVAPRSVLPAALQSCAPLAVRAAVGVGPPPLLDPVSGAVGPRPVAPVGRYEGAKAPVVRGDSLECTYRVTGLPVGVPLSLSAEAAAGVGAVPLVRFRPIGWNGVTVANTVSRNFGP